MPIYKILKTLNIVASIIIAILGAFILIRPFLPDIILKLNANEFQGYVYKSETSLKAIGQKASELEEIPEENVLVIPKIYVNAKINEGEDISTLNFGTWRRPETSTPDKGSNTVITAHRFLHTSGPNTFYHLDKLKIDDIILVYWEGKEYVYKIFNIFEVTERRVEIEDPTKEPILTLYTCTPLWTSENRLVVTAKPQ